MKKNAQNPSGSRRQLWLGLLLVAAVLAYGARFVWRAHKNLVTFDVREMDVRKLVKKMEWQTWEDIHVHQEVQGKVTLKVQNAHLDDVLRIVASQAQARPVLFYALYKDGASLSRLERSLLGQIDPAKNGWTNLAGRGFGGFGGFGGPGGGMFNFGGGPGGANQSATGDGLVTLNLTGKTVDFVAQAFSRFTGTRLVPEDGVREMATVNLEKETVPKAVAKVAKSVKRKWVAVYALEAGFGFDRGDRGGDRQRGPRGGGEDGGTNSRPNFRGGFGGDLTDAQRDEMRAQREAQELALRQALPPEARQKIEQAQQEREAMFRDAQNTTPEQMRDRFMGQNSAAMNQMMRERLMNQTPEQRAQQRQQMGRRGGGPGGPGGGGGGPGGGR